MLVVCCVRVRMGKETFNRVWAPFHCSYSEPPLYTKTGTDLLPLVPDDCMLCEGENGTGNVSI